MHIEPFGLRTGTVGEAHGEHSTLRIIPSDSSLSMDSSYASLIGNGKVRVFKYTGCSSCTRKVIFIDLSLPTADESKSSGNLASICSRISACVKASVIAALTEKFHTKEVGKGIVNHDLAERDPWYQQHVIAHCAIDRSW